MTQEEFVVLLEKYLKGNCSEEEIRFIEQWYDGLDIRSRSLAVDEQNLEAKILQKLHESVESRSRKYLVPQRRVERRIWLAAASIAFVVVSVSYAIWKMDPKPDRVALNITRIDDRLKHLKNRSAGADTIPMPDGSTIILHPGGSIKYDSTFSGEKREVYLEGLAFFDVKRDESRPFFVYAGNIVTKVLGTSFTINASRESDEISVKVRTGKVQVYNAAGKNSQGTASEINTLTPNQQIHINRATNTAKRSLVSEPEIVVPVEEVKKIRFENVPVTEIWKALERIYGIKIVFEEEVFKSCTLTTAISDGGIYRRLDIICKAIGATYVIEDNQIRIAGLGCE